jgi:hypothetical protein
MEAVVSLRPDLGDFEKVAKQALESVGETAESTADDMQEAFGEASDDAQESLDGIDGEGMSSRLQDHIGKISVAFAGIGVASEAFSRTQGETNATLERVGIISGTTSSELRDLIGTMVDHTFSAEDAAAGMERLAKAGITTGEEFATILPLMDTFADATGGDVVGSIDLFDRVLSALDVPLSEAGDHMDALGFLANQTTVPMNNLAMLMRRESGTLREYGMSTDDIAVAMAALEAEGIRGPRAVMAFQSALAEGEGDIAAFEAALGLTSGQLDTQRQRLADSAGAIDQFAQVNNNAMTPVEKLQANMGNLMFRFGGLANAAGIAAAPIAAMGPMMMGLNATQQVLSSGMGKNLVSGLRGATAAFRTLSVAIFTNPIFLIGALIVVVVALIWKFREQILSALVGAWDIVKEKVGAVFNWMRNGIQALANGIRSTFSGIANTIRSVFTSVINTAKGMINQLIRMFERVINGPAQAANSLIRTANRLPGVNLPTLPTINIPRLAEGGDIMRGGRVMVGEEGPEFLDLPRGARVTPLDKAGETNITMNVTVQGGSFNEEKLARELDKLARRAAATSGYRRPE